MATVIDSLIVELGLDASKFNNEQKKAVESLRKFKDKTKEHVDPVQEGFDGLLKTFGAIQGRLLAIAGIVAAGLGFNRLIQDATRLNSELGYMSKSLGVSAAELSKWEAAGATVGAQANEIASSFAAIQKSMAEMQLTGSSPLNAFAYTTHQSGQGPAVELYDSKGKWRDPTDILIDISKWAEKQENKAVASQMIGKLGMGQGMTNMLLLGPDELKKRLKEQEKFAPSDDDIKKFQQLQEAFGNLVTIIGVFERLLASKLAPALTKIINKITEFLRKIGLGENPADVAGDTAAKSGFTELAPNAAKPSLAARAWNWLRGKESGGAAAGGGFANPSGGPNGAVRDRFGGWGGSSDAPGGSRPSGGGNDNGDAGAGVPRSDFLAKEREEFTRQIQDPSVREQVAGMAVTEDSRDPVPAIESLANRFGLVNSERAKRGLPPVTVEEMLHSGFYGPINRGQLPGAIGQLRGNPNLQSRMDRAMQAVQGGSNTIRGYTDQGLRTDPNGMHQPQMSRGTGNIYTDWGGGPGHAAAAAYRQRLMAGVEADAASKQASQGLPGWLPGASSNSATGDTATARSFSNWQNLGGARSALNSGSSVSNSSSSSTHIGEMNVTVPPGADPATYGSGIRQELQRFDNVQNSNTGLR